MAFWKKKTRVSEEILEEEIQKELDKISFSEEEIDVTEMTEDDGEEVFQREISTDEKEEVGEKEIPSEEKQIQNFEDSFDGKKEFDDFMERVKSLEVGSSVRFIEECCQIVLRLEEQTKKYRVEYDAVTRYLSDIQIIDRMKGETKKVVQDYCGMIVKLTKERNHFRNQNLTITNSQMERLKPYENQLVDEIKKMYQEEAYQNAIDSDMEKLNSEKEMLLNEEKEIVIRQQELKKMAKILCVFIVSLFALFGTIYLGVGRDMTLPYMATVLLAGVSSLIIFLEANHNKRNMVLVERKRNRAIELLNRVKIKYVNNQNVLSYDKEKYGVENAEDFENIWGQYTKAREYERRYQENAKRLQEVSGSLVELLNQEGLHDAEVWTSQAIAIVDNREMVEIRHNLNQRRQEVRDNITFSIDEKKKVLYEIDQYLQAHAEEKEELLEIIRKKIKKPLTDEK